MSAPSSSSDSTTAERILPIGTTVLIAALLFAVLRQGAYHDGQHQVFAWVTLGAGVLLAVDRAGRRALVVAMIVIGPVLLSSSLSTAMSAERSDARSTFLEIVLVGVGLAAGAAVPKRQRHVVVHAVLLIAIVVAATAVFGVATHTTPWGRITSGVWRGSSSLTYANAAAAVVGPAALLAFNQSARHATRVYPVIAGALSIGLLSTQSRAGIAATLLIGVWLAGKLGSRLFAETALPIVAGVAIGSPLLLAYASTGQDPQAVVVLALVAVGLGVTALASPLRVRVGNPVVVLGIVLAVAIGAGILGGAASSLGDRITLRSGTTAQGNDAQVLFGDRAKEWSTAWDRVVEQPLIGHGPGVVDLRWIEDGRSFRALFVHNEYLELGVTHGALGLLALVASAFLFHRARRGTPVEPPVLFTIAAFLVHSGFDYLWHIPALPVVFAMLAGTALDSERGAFARVR